MSKDQEKTKDVSPVSLATMLNAGDAFYPSNQKMYKIQGLALSEVQELMDDRISVDSQLYNMANEELKKNTDKWIKRKFRDDKGDPVSLDDLIKDDWTLIDLKQAIKKMADLSG